MELDDMKQAWQSLDQRLEQLTQLEFGRQRETRLEAARRSLRSLTRWQGFQLVAGIGLCLLFAPYWVAHRDVTHLAVYGLALHAYGIMFIVFASYTITLIRRIDYAAPVLAIQQQMFELARWRARIEGPAFAVAGCFIWIPLLLILFRALGLDVWTYRPQVVHVFIASGFVCLAIVAMILLAIVRANTQSKTSGWAARLRDSSVGRNILLARAQLDEITRFERN